MRRPRASRRQLLAQLDPAELRGERAGGRADRSEADRAPGNNEPIGGIKVVAKSGWFAARPSGTEDVYKIYAESFRSEEHLRQIQRDAQALIGRLFEKK